MVFTARGSDGRPLPSVAAVCINRYLHALKFAKGPILDCACGIGHGSNMMADEGHEVTAVDIDPDSIAIALEHYTHENVIQWIRADLFTRPWGERKFKTIISFETLEHLDDAPAAVGLFRDSVTDDGLLIASVPNEDVMRFDPEVFADHTDAMRHRRHYMPDEFNELLQGNGWRVIHRGTAGKSTPVRNGTDSKYLFFTCEPA